MPGKIMCVIISFFFLVISCSKDDDTSNPPPDVQEDAPIGGQVMLFDEGTSPLAKNGMLVSLDSTFPPYGVVTDNNGRFAIPKVPYGKRTLVFEKTGYGTYKIFNIDHVDNNTIGTTVSAIPSLGKMSTTTVTDLTSIVASGTVTISVTTNPAGDDAIPKYIRIFLSLRSAVSNTNFMRALETSVAKTNPFKMTLSKAELNEMGFTSGLTVYVKVYGESFYSNEYDDPNIGRTIFPNLNASTVAATSFIVP